MRFLHFFESCIWIDSIFIRGVGFKNKLRNIQPYRPRSTLKILGGGTLSVWKSDRVGFFAKKQKQGRRGLSSAENGLILQKCRGDPIKRSITFGLVILAGNWTFPVP
ncbi:hypothetical protein CEXT_406071 [Caerostris extrusa]|uniref:Uncharacterized protein n=1 Tax=Caerostris extrusa TaxID=172846 RepID=A0AAV4P0N5_CAEEX|nr:hypothetical protein CEXT_406071 [Caerostris extrusa]